MIINQQQILADIETHQTADKYALLQANQQLATLGFSTTPGKPSAGAANNDELLQLRAAMNRADSQYINSGSSDENLRKRYQNLKDQYYQKVAGLQTAGTTIDPSTGTDEKTKLLERKNQLEVNLEGKPPISIRSMNGSIHSRAP